MPLRIASVWLALAVALLSSLMSEGLPRTTALGSAFNPATTAVALQPSRAQPRVALDRLRRDDDPVGGQGAAVAGPSVPLHPAAAPPAALVALKPGRAAHPVAPRVMLDGTPRGPPVN